MLDPIGGYEKIRDLLVSQIETTQRIKNSSLQASRRNLLLNTDVLTNSPIIEPVPRYQASEYYLEDLLDLENENPLQDFSPLERSIFINLVLSGLFDSIANNTHPILSRKSLYKPYLHQMQMLAKGVKNGQPGVVTSGTGSGKTESFMLPILAAITKEAIKWPVPSKPLNGNEWFQNGNNFELQRKNEHPDRPKAVRALVLYPMNALVEDQLTRLRKTLSAPEVLQVLDAQANGNRIYFGRYTSKSPVTGFLDHPRLANDLDEIKARKKRIQKLREALSDVQEYYENAKKFDEEGLAHTEETRYLFPNVLGSELVSRWDMQETPPDILVTNTSMLSIMLSREVDQGIFEKTKQWIISDPDAYFYLVLDELHLIRGSAGTEIAGLLRYLIHRLGLDQPEHRHKLRILASSASLPTEGTLANESLKYLSDFFACNGLYKSPVDTPDVHQWLHAIVKGEQIRFDTVVDQLDAQIFETFTKQYDELKFNYDAFQQLNHNEQKVESLASCFEHILSAIFLYLGLSQPTFIERLKALIEYSSNLLSSHCFDHEIDSLKPRSLAHLSKSIFGSENIKALRGLLIIRGLNDLLPQPYRGDNLPSLRVHTFFKSLEGLYAVPQVTQDGISFLEGSLSTDRGKHLTKTINGIQRNFEWLVCEACGELFIGGNKRKDSPTQISISTIGFNLEELPERATDTLYENLMAEKYAVFLPTSNEKKIDDPSWKLKYLDVRNGVLCHKKESEEYIAGFYFEPKDQPTLERAGGALPVECPCCLTNYKGRVFYNIRPASPIRSFRMGFAKTSQMLATQLFSFLKKTSEDAKTIVFSDSRQDAARAALNIESLHHQDLRRLLLVKSIKKSLAEYQPDFDIEEIRAKQADALKSGNIAVIIETQKQIEEYEHKNNSKRICLTDLIEITKDLKVSPFLTSLTTMGIHPSDASGIGKIQNQPWWEWFDWEDPEEPKWKHGSDDGAGSNFTAREKIRENINELAYEVLFSKTAYALEETGLAWVGVTATDDVEGLKLDAWLRVLADNYRVRGSKYFSDEDKMPYTRAADIKTSSKLYKFAKSINPIDPENALNEAIKKFDQFGHSAMKVDLERLYIQLTSEDDPYFRCDKCGRVHLHQGVGKCTRCFEPLPKVPTGKVQELWNQHYLSKKILQSLDEDIFRLHCEELTGQTNDPAQRLQHFKGIFIDQEQHDQCTHIKKRAKEIDLLSVTTTMEVGIDIGALQAVYQANMPPQRFNYQQRVGRAGRRGQSYSMIVTLCRNKSHDTYYYENPEAITADPPPPPFLSFDLLQIHKRIVNKVWLTYAFDVIKLDYENKGVKYPGDEVQGSTHGDFPYASLIYSSSKWKEILFDALEASLYKKNQFVQSMLGFNTSLCDSLVHYSADDLLSLIYKFEDEGKKSNKPFGEYLANKGILPLYGMPSNVREFYLGVSEKGNLISVDRDSETAIYEFAPNQTLVVDKQTYQSKGFVPSLYVPTFGKEIKKSNNDKDAWFYENFEVAKCLQCSMFNLKQESDVHRCHNCQYELNENQFVHYVDPAAYISSGEPLNNKEIDELEFQHFDRVVTLINKPTNFKNITDSNLSIGGSADNGTFVLRLNQGVNLATNMCSGFTMYDRDKLALSSPKSKYWLESVKYLSKYPDAQSSIGLATLKKTDGLYLRPQYIDSILDFSNLSRNKDAIAIRAGLISATQILLQRAALELDIDPEEFEQIEPKLIDGFPVLQICDKLANGAGFSQKLSEVRQSSNSPLILELIGSILSNVNDILGLKLRSDKHKASCLGACYKCIQRYGNRTYHGLLDWRLGLSFLRLLYDQDYKCGLDGDFSYIELRDWHDQVEKSLININLMRPSIYTKPKLLEFRGVEFWSISNSKKNEIYVVVHPFWSKTYLEDMFNKDNLFPMKIINSFELLNMPQDIF